MTKGIRDMCLSDELSKSLRTVSTIQSGDHSGSLPGGAGRATKKRLLAHPPEPSYPCYVSVLGELAKLVPREERFNNTNSLRRLGYLLLAGQNSFGALFSETLGDNASQIFAHLSFIRFFPSDLLF